jgi:Flp pilus assembly protein TadD
LGQPEEGWRLLVRALALDPDDCQVHAHYRTALVDQGRVEEARTHFLKALTLRPDFGSTLSPLACTRRFRGLPPCPPAKPGAWN